MTNKFYVYNNFFGDFEFNFNKSTIEFNVYIELDPGVLVRIADSCESVQVFVPKEDWPEFVKRINSIKFDEKMSGKPSK